MSCSSGSVSEASLCTLWTELGCLLGGVGLKGVSGASSGSGVELILIISLSGVPGGVWSGVELVSDSGVAGEVLLASSISFLTLSSSALRLHE